MTASSTSGTGRLTDTEARERLDRLRGLSDGERMSLLCFLDGAAPEDVDAGLRRLADAAERLGAPDDF